MTCARLGLKWRRVAQFVSLILSSETIWIQWQDRVKTTGDIIGCSGWSWCPTCHTTSCALHSSLLVIAFQPVDHFALSAESRLHILVEQNPISRRSRISYHQHILRHARRIVGTWDGGNVQWHGSRLDLYHPITRSRTMAHPSPNPKCSVGKTVQCLHWARGPRHQLPPPPPPLSLSLTHTQRFLSLNGLPCAPNTPPISSNTTPVLSCTGSHYKSLDLTHEARLKIKWYFGWLRYQMIVEIPSN